MAEFMTTLTIVMVSTAALFRVFAAIWSIIDHNELQNDASIIDDYDEI